MTDESKLLPRIYEWEYGVEELERYEVGGYHPIHIGDELRGGRYRIVHKLGYGSFGTVWLVRDQLKNRYSALKIAIADPPKQEATIGSRVISWFLRVNPAAARLLRVTGSTEEAATSREKTDELRKRTESQFLHHLYLQRGAWFHRILKGFVHQLDLLLGVTWFSETSKTFGRRLDLLLEGTQLSKALKVFWHGRGHPGSNYILEMLDRFEIRGPNGKHQCIVLEPLGPSLTAVFECLREGILPSDAARKVSMQLAEGLSYLHTSGIVHGGM